MEVRRNGAVAIDSFDCFCENGSNGKNCDFAAFCFLFFAYGNGIEKNEFFKNAVFDSLDCGTGKRTVSCTSGYGKSSANFDKCFCCVAKGTCGIYHVVKDDAFFAFYVTDDVHNFGNVCFGTAFIDDCKRDIEFFSKFTNAVYAAVVGRNRNIFIFM